jgi:hypothetical protein
MEGPFRLVFGLTDGPGLGELLLLFEVDLSLLNAPVGIFCYRGRVVSGWVVVEVLSFGFLVDVGSTLTMLG